MASRRSSGLASDVGVRGGGVDLGQGLAALRASEKTQELDGLALELGVGLAAGDADHDLPRPRRARLAEDEESSLAHARGGAPPGQQLLQHGHRPFGVGPEEGVEGHELQVLVGLALRAGGLAGPLSHL